MRLAFIISTLLFLVLAACSSEEAELSENDIQTEQELAHYTFEEEAEFETGSFSERRAEGSLSLVAEAYQIQIQAERATYLWGQAGDPVKNVVIEAEAAPQNDFSDNLYGLMCRVTEDGTGYAFLIGNDGYAAIALAQNDILRFLLDWREHPDIQKGQKNNRIRAVCIDDYLALYVNGEFMGDVRDEEHTESGQVGLIAGVTSEGETIVQFDNLTLIAASLDK